MSLLLPKWFYDRHGENACLYVRPVNATPYVIHPVVMIKLHSIASPYKSRFSTETIQYNILKEKVELLFVTGEYR